MHFVPFRSRSGLHKTPFGAAAAGEEITLRVILPRHMQCRGVTLCWGDYDGAWERHQPFAWDGMEGEHEEWWQCRFVPEQPGLYRYRFRYESDYGGGMIGNEGQGVGCIGAGDWFRLTVYGLPQGDLLPSWVPGGVMYQIFPDRFYRADKAEQAMPEERILRDDWNGTPQWNPDAQGRITQYDFFGGNLEGIRQKLGYLKSLGVTCIYLNPIFLARSNHRYDTADYAAIDPLLGDDDDFARLCAQAHAMGMRLILDGVFSHTGADSIYFNKYHTFPGPGAYESQESPYYGWFTFKHWPEDYASWWGIDILPELREDHPAVLEFFNGEMGVVRHWLRKGADGWRLDVADELPDVFLDQLFAAARDEKPDAYVLGEVWEDASLKWSHGGRRRFLLGGQMHSVMNYPLANAILRFARSGAAEQLADTVMEQQEHYPPYAIAGLMNHIGTHDTPRILNRLAGDADPDRREDVQLTHGQLEKARRSLKLCAALQYILPGNPCVYYGDEAGLQGAKDPFNRACYPWDAQDETLLAWYRTLGALREQYRDVFSGTGVRLLSACLGCAAFVRSGPDEDIIVIANANPHGIDYVLPPDLRGAAALLGGTVQGGTVAVPAQAAVILINN